MSKKGSAPEADSAGLSEESITAVIVTEWAEAEKSFHPLSVDQPACLLPLGGVALLDLAVEAAVSSGATLLAFLTAKHDAQIRVRVTALMQSKRFKSVAALSVKFHRLDARPRSLTDALRRASFFLQEQNVTDFIAMFAVALCTAPLANGVALHRLRGRGNPCMLLTLIACDTDNNDELRSAFDERVFATDGATQRLVALTDAPRRGAAPPPHLLMDHKLLTSATEALCVRGDLVRSEVLLGGAKLLSVLNEYFDYDLDAVLQMALEGDLESLDVFVAGPQQLASTAPSAAPSKAKRGAADGPLLAVPVRGPRALRAAALAVRDAEGAYRVRGSRLTFEPDGGRSLAAGATISDSVISSGCVVEPGAAVEGSLLLPNVTVRSGARLRSCVVGSGSEVGRDVVVHPGAIIGCNVRVPDGTEVPANSRLSPPSAEGAASGATAKAKTTDDDEEDFGESDDEEEAMEASGEAGMGQRGADFVKLSLPITQSKGGEQRPVPKAGPVGLDSDEEEEWDKEAADFRSEVEALVNEGLHQPEHMVHKFLELKSLRLTAARPLPEMVGACVNAVLAYLAAELPDATADAWIDGLERSAAVQLFREFINERTYPDLKTPFLTALLHFCSRKTSSGKDNPFYKEVNHFATLLNVLVRLNVVREESEIVEFVEVTTSRLDKALKEDQDNQFCVAQLRALQSPKMTAYVQHIMSNDDSDDDDDESESEDDE
eukprot:Selendium_serpulae@DN3692_c0_g1_i1.p1